MEWLKRFPTLGQGEQLDQELRWNAASSYFSQLRHSDTCYARFLREAEACPLVADAVWVARSGAPTWSHLCEYARVRGDRRHPSTFYYDMSGGSTKRYEMLKTAVDMGHTKAALELLRAIFGSLMHLDYRLNRGPEEEEEDADELRSQIKLCEDDLRSLAPRIVEIFKANPGCRGDYLYVLTFDMDSSQEHRALFGELANSTLEDAIAAGSQRGVHTWAFTEDVVLIKFDRHNSYAIATSFLRSLFVLDDSTIRDLLDNLGRTIDYNPRVVSMFVDGLKDPREMVRQFLLPSRMGSWDRLFRFRAYCMNNVLAWTMCAKKMGIHRDMRIMIAQHIWDERHETPPADPLPVVTSWQKFIVSYDKRK